MEPNNNFNILAWYNSLDKQNHRKFYVYGRVWGLVSPSNALLPFQVVRNTAASGVTGLDVYKLDGTFVRSVLSDANIKVLKFEGYDIIKYHGDNLSSPLPVGKYYLKMTDGTNTWYSEVFSVVPDISSFIKLEYWNNDNLYYKDGHIDYSEGFRFCCYLCTAIGKPGYNFEEELTERDGYKFIEKQVSSKVYNMTFAAPEFICDALRLVRMCDNIRITDKDDIYKILSFTVDPKWEDNGDLAAVDTEFETDTVVTKITNVLNGPSEGGGDGNFIDALLYEKDGPIMFDQNVVAQYQKTVTVRAEGVATGKLIRELDEFDGDLTNAMTVPLDLGSGPARKISLKLAVEGTGKDIYLRKDIDDTAHGTISFDRDIKSTVFLDGFEGKGWRVSADGSSIFEAINVRQNVFIGNKIGSPVFISGFPNGLGWDLSPYKRTNAAGVEETKYRLEIDDIIVRGKLRVFEMVISQLRGENDNVIFAGMMKVDHYDESTGRIYLDTEEGVLYNPFRPGDILMVQRFGGLPSAGNNYNVIKQYELRVADVGVGSLTDGEDRLDWLTFTNFVGDIADIEQGDVLTRVDSVSDSTRKGIVKVTTIDEIGAPYIDVVYGMKTDPLNATKARMGNLTGIRTKSGVDLTDIWGFYGNGAYLENSTYVLNNGNTIEQEFSIMNGEFNSIINQIKNDMSLEAGNILINSTFGENTNYWVASNSGIHFYSVNGKFLLANGYFMSEKGSVADIYQDGSRNVLRLKNSQILQLNSVMDLPTHEDSEIKEYTYSFSLFYKVLSKGTLTVGVDNTNLFLQKELDATPDYVKLSHTSKWNETGDFKISFTGEILIYGVSLFNDALADAEVRLQTQITQNAEAIKLTATKEYVDSETGAIYTKYDAQLSIMADEISQRVTREDFDAETGDLEQRLEGKITVQADRIDAAVTDIDNINNTIETAGWITTAQGNQLYASKTLEDGNTLVSYINQTATTVSINASKINLNGAVTFSSFSSALQQDFNDKVDSNSLSSILSDYVTEYQLSNTLDEYALASDLSKYVNSTQLSNALLSYATKEYADTSSSDAVDTFWGALKTGNTSIINGVISTVFIDVDTIFANAAYIGNFEIRNGWLICNANTAGDVGYIDMRGTNTRIAFGRDLVPANAGGSFTCTAMIKNGNIAGYGGVTYGLDITVQGSINNKVVPIALSANGGISSFGSCGVIEDLFVPTNSGITAAMLRYQRTFIFQRSGSTTNLVLPTDSEIQSEFGQFKSNQNVVDHGAITIYLLATRYQTYDVYVTCAGGANNNIIDSQGNVVSEVEGGKTGVWLRKGNSLIMMYYNRNWYVLNRSN